MNSNPFTMAITMIYTQLQSIYNLLQLNYNYPYGYLQYVWADNYNIIVIKSSVLCTMAYRHRLRDC